MWFSLKEEAAFQRLFLAFIKMDGHLFVFTESNEAAVCGQPQCCLLLLVS